MVGLGVDALDTLDPGVQDVVGGAKWAAGKITGQEIEAPQLSDFHKEYFEDDDEDEKNNIFRIGDADFPISSCVLKACVSAKAFRWELWIFSTGTLGDLPVRPVASCPYLMEPVIPVKNWREVLNETRNWDRAYDDSLQGPRGTLAVFSHEDIDKTKICFEYIESDRFHVTWTGITDVQADYFDDTDEITFESNCEGVFIGLESRGLAPEAAIAKAREFVTETNWHLVEERGPGLFLFKEAANNGIEGSE